MKTTERLLAAAKDIWAAYNEHPFVLGIQNGTLAREKFKYYIIQDYLYLEEYAKVFALGIAKAKSPETIQLFSKYVRRGRRRFWRLSSPVPTAMRSSPGR